MKDFNRYKWVFTQTPKQLLSSALPDYLKRAGYTAPQKGDGYAYFKGDIPIMLVSHVDTVHKNLPADIFCDKKKGVLWSPNGLGADDRAGIAGILAICDKGLRPHVLFVDEEETGGHGAKQATKFCSLCDVRYIIELDREGCGESVFYDCVNPKFEKYVNGFGFKTDVGSFSDISILCPNWGIAGVNLSIGYHNAHSSSEYLRVSEWENTIKKLTTMLQNPPSKIFAYIEAPVEYIGRNYYSDWVEKSFDAAWKAPSRLIKGNEEIVIAINADDLSNLYNGSPTFWAEFIASYGADLERIITDYAWEQVDEIALPYWSDNGPYDVEEEGEGLCL